MGGSPEGLLETLEMVEEALSLRRRVQGVAPLLQGDAMPGPVAARPYGTAGSRWRGRGWGRDTPPLGPLPATCPLLLVAAAPLVPAEDAGVVGAEHSGVVAAHLAQCRQPLVQLVDALGRGGQTLRGGGPRL